MAMDDPRLVYRCSTTSTQITKTGRVARRSDRSAKRSRWMTGGVRVAVVSNWDERLIRR